MVLLTLNIITAVALTTAATLWIEQDTFREHSNARRVPVRLQAREPDIETGLLVHVSAAIILTVITTVLSGGPPFLAIGAAMLLTVSSLSLREENHRDLVFPLAFALTPQKASSPDRLRQAALRLERRTARQARTDARRSRKSALQNLGEGLSQGLSKSLDTQRAVTMSAPRREDLTHGPVKAGQPSSTQAAPSVTATKRDAKTSRAKRKG